MFTVLFLVAGTIMLTWWIQCSTNKRLWDQKPLSCRKTTSLFQPKPDLTIHHQLYVPTKSIIFSCFFDFLEVAFDLVVKVMSAGLLPKSKLCIQILKEHFGDVVSVRKINCSNSVYIQVYIFMNLSHNYLIERGRSAVQAWQGAFASNIQCVDVQSA